MVEQVFEGPEKTVEIWFRPGKDSKSLRQVDTKFWEQILQLVQAQILSVVRNESADAYLLRHDRTF